MTVSTFKKPATTLWNLNNIVAELYDARLAWRSRQHRTESTGREFPSRDSLQNIISLLSGALFPLRLGPDDIHPESENFYVGYALDKALNNLLEQAHLEIRYHDRQYETVEKSTHEKAKEIVSQFANQLASIRHLLDSDVEAAYKGDPAAQTVDEVLLCYPGIIAMIHYRLAHPLYQLGLPLIARIITELAHSATGIDIHPGAQIGEGFFVDHGTGVVIGETAVIGKNVRLYQAVTLGAKRFHVHDNGQLQKGQARHPIVEDDVVIYAGATILGRITIGKGSTIGGNVWLTRSVPAYSHITQASSQEEAAV